MCVSVHFAACVLVSKEVGIVHSLDLDSSCEESKMGAAIQTLVLPGTRSPRSHCFLSSATEPSALHSLACFVLIVAIALYFRFCTLLCFIFETVFL